MHDTNDASELSGRLLVAMPAMGDPRFAHSVVLICAHSDQGAMGLIVNKPAREIDVHDLLKQLEIEVAPGAAPIRVHFGGPVECGRGFVLHSADYPATQSTLQIDAQFGMTATLDILQDIARGNGPGDAILALGYAGWGPGQLEDEIRENGWLICDASSEIVFGDADDGKWRAALKSLGIDALLLSSEGGRA
jgi:putative transcriptional regulator